jgi:hypothetical protein
MSGFPGKLRWNSVSRTFGGMIMGIAWGKQAKGRDTDARILFDSSLQTNSATISQIEDTELTQPGIRTI